MIRTTLVVLGVFAAVLFVLWLSIPNSSPSHRHHPEWVMCNTGLWILGTHLQTRRDEGRLQALTGSQFLLQIAGDLHDAELHHLVCPGDLERRVERRELWNESEEFIQRCRDDWRSTPCSYRGPDKELLAEIMASTRKITPAIIACDANGPDGRTPYHPNGINVLYENGEVEFLEWYEIKGSDGDPVPVGPDSPDPRLRHLVR